MNGPSPTERAKSELALAKLTNHMRKALLNEARVHLKRACAALDDFQRLSEEPTT